MPQSQTDAVVEVTVARRRPDRRRADLGVALRRAPPRGNGKWSADEPAPNEGAAAVVIPPPADGGKEWRFPVGDPPAAAGFGAVGEPPLAISGDGKWALFTTYPKSVEAKKLRKDKKPLQDGAVPVNLAHGEKRDFEKGRRGNFAGETALKQL